MTVNFESVFVQNGNDFNIKFTVPLLKEDEFEGARVIEFMDPEKRVVNRFEFGEKNILIISGPSAIELELDQHVDSEFIQDNQRFPIVTYLTSYHNTHNLYKFAYILLSPKGDEIGKFNITIEITED